MTVQVVGRLPAAPSPLGKPEPEPVPVSALRASVNYRGEPFNAFRAYEREREHTRKLERTLSRALTLLDMECGRRELRGEDVAHIRAFLREAADV